MEIDPHRRWESVGNFACVMTQAVLAMVVFCHSRRVRRMFKMYKTIELRYIYIVALTHNSYLTIIRLSEYNHAETIFRRDR